MSDGYGVPENSCLSQSLYFLIIYNLPFWLVMKRKYMMLSMMISRSKQPGNDIDVYLTSLIEDLRLL